MIFPVAIGMFQEAEGGFTTQYQAVLNRGAFLGYGLPTAGQQIKENQQVINDLASGAFAKKDIHYSWATDGDSDWATLNWKDPLNFQCLKVNSPIFITGVGFQGDKVSAYLDTQYNPLGDAINVTSTNAGKFIWVAAISTGGNAMQGAVNANREKMFNANNNQQQIATTTPSMVNVVDFSGTGLKALNKAATLENRAYVDLGSVTDMVSANDVLTSSNLRIFQSGIFFGDMTLSFFGYGSNMEPEKIGLFNTLNDYLASL